MTELYAFLHPETPENKEVLIKRFKNEKGEVVPFIIRPVTADENDALLKRCRYTIKGRRGEERKLDSVKYQRALVVKATVTPDFTSKELCDAYGVVDPELCTARMLYAGEFQLLVDEILNLSGLDDESGEAVEEEAKN